VTEVLNKMDYRVRVDGKTKTYYANLSKLYISRGRNEAASKDNADQFRVAKLIHWITLIVA